MNKSVPCFTRDRRQISLLILSELIEFYSPLNHKKTYASLTISGGIAIQSTEQYDISYNL